MAAKRLAASEAESYDADQPRGKRRRPISSFASVIGEVMMVKSFQSLCNSLEPLIRRVVTEEVERGLQRNIRRISRCPSLRIQAPEPANLRLMFTNTNLPTIFTCNPIFDIDGKPLQLVIVEQLGDQMTPKVLPYPIKIELVAVDGDFPASLDRNVWTATEFNRSIIKERDGRRPLLTKEVNYTIRNTSYLTLGELEFTDNSSWLRSRKFKVGARVVVETSHGARFLEALTEAFIVKDHRGELYRKHYPPMLDDNVWRLEKIGKDGKFHKRLSNASIFTVQDFLKMSVIDPARLKTILGGRAGISEKMWETVLRHAKTCEIGDKLYISRGSNYTLILDAICQIFSIKIDGQNSQDLSTSLKQEVDQLVKTAYENWDSLQEVERTVNEVLQNSQGTTMAICNDREMMPYEIVLGGIIELGCPQVINNNMHIEFEDWEASHLIFN